MAHDGKLYIDYDPQADDILSKKEDLEESKEKASASQADQSQNQSFE